MRTAILGCSGLLGRELCRVLAGDVVPIPRSDADLTDLDALRNALARIRPDILINAAAYTEVDRAETEPTSAFAVNAIAMRELSLYCRDSGCTLIHFSTDYVFGLDGTRRAAYDESDAPGPINAYGASKLAGEHFVRAICPTHFILRTCGLYGPSAGHGRSNFVESILRKASTGGPLRVVADQVCTPTYVADLARAVVDLLGSRSFGVYHVTNGGACSWHEFAEAIVEDAGLDCEVTPISSKEYASPTPRPCFSVLSNARWLDAGFTPLPLWRDALRRYLASRPAPMQPPHFQIRSLLKA